MITTNLLAFATSLEKGREKAMTATDSKLLNELLSEELCYGHSSGYTDTKSTFIEKLNSAVYRYSFVKTRIHQVTPIGELGIVINGEVIISVNLYGQEKQMHSVYLAVWRSEAEGWRFLSHQTAQIRA